MRFLCVARALGRSIVVCLLCVARAPGRFIDVRCVRWPQNTARAISCLSFQGMDGENDKQNQV